MEEAGQQVRRYRCGDFVIDERRGVLQRHGEDVPLRPKSWDVLRLLVLHRGELVTKQALLDAVWRRRIVSEGVVAKSVREIRQALGDENRAVIRTVPGRGYLFDAPVTLEATPEVDRDEAGASPAAPVTDPAADSIPATPMASSLPPMSTARRETLPGAHRWRHASLGVLLLLVVAVAWSVVLRTDDSSPPLADVSPFAPPERSIAVLPFEDMSPDGDQQYLADGMAEEILNLLAASEELTVIARTSSFAFRDEPADVRTIGRRLNVAYLIEGSLRRSGDDLRVAVQLVDTRDGTRTWSASYDRPTRDTLGLQSEIAGAVSDQLHVRLVDSADRRPVDPVAHVLYLQARQLSNLPGTADTQRELVEHALELEPDYLDAKITLAWTHRRSSSSARWDGDTETAKRHDEKYDSLVDEVLVQDPGHTGANVLRAWEMLYLADVAGAAMYAERALESGPTNPDALTTAGEILDRLWRAEQAIPILRYASERDPLNAYHFDNLAGAYLNAGHYSSAEEAFRTFLILSPEDDWARYGIGIALLLQGKASEALQHFDENLGEDHPLRWHGKTLALHDLDRTDEAQSELAKLLAVDDPLEELVYWLVGTAYAWIGAKDEAFGFLEKQREAHPRVFTSVGDSPLYANLRDDPRWRPFLASVKIDPDFLASVAFDPKLPSEVRRSLVAPIANQRYMEARFLFNRRFDGDLAQAEALYLEATRIAPDFARAWAGLAGVYWVRTTLGYPDSIRLSIPEALDAMALPIERALQADPDLAEAHIRAFTYFRRTGEPARARNHLARARTLAPNDPLVLASLAWPAGGSEPTEDQVAVHRKIIAVDPLSLVARYNFAHFLIRDHLLIEARREIEAALSLFPAATSEFAYLSAVIDLLEGDFEAAATAAEELPDKSDRLHEEAALLAMAWWGLGLTDRTAEVLAQLEQEPGEWAALRLAEIHAYRGARREAFAWLREALHRAADESFEGHQFWQVISNSPFFDDLEDDPRWHDLRAQAEALVARLELIARGGRRPSGWRS